MGTTNYHQYTHDQRLAYLKEFDESGQSVRAFCENRELNQWTLGKWVKERRHNRGVFDAGEMNKHGFVNLTVMKPVQETLTGQNARSNADHITVHHGRWYISIPRYVRSSDLAEVMRALEAVDGV
ncbi:MAG: transposase [Sphaerochaetaceae bacterium]|nr:transposase [Sphaerochaetaceae bacterium]